MAEQVRYELDGLVVPTAIVGRAGVDACNTLAGWDDPATARDYWETYDHLVTWGRSVGLVSVEEAGRLRTRSSSQEARAHRVLAEARRWRAALRSALLDGDPGAVGAVGRAASAALGRAELVADRAGARPAWRFAPGLRAPLDAAAYAGALALTEGAGADLRACPGDGCGWVFEDRTGRRRWCRMAWCGNRAKVRAHARRAAGDR